MKKWLKSEVYETCEQYTGALLTGEQSKVAAIETCAKKKKKKKRVKRKRGCRISVSKPTLNRLPKRQFGPKVR